MGDLRAGLKQVFEDAWRWSALPGWRGAVYDYMADGVFWRLAEHIQQDKSLQTANDVAEYLVSLMKDKEWGSK